MDLLIIAPGNHRGIFQELAEANYPAIEPPVWAGLIANFCRSKSIDVQIIDQSAENLSPEEIAKKVDLIKPRMVAHVVYGHQPSASTQTMTIAYMVIQKINELDLDLKQIVIGGHPSALPEQTLNESQADFVVQGEGPETIEALFSLKKWSDTSQLKNIPGLWFKENGKSVFAKASTVIPQKELSKILPGVAWDLLPMNAYRAHNWHAFSNNFKRQPYASLYTSLGCPFRCSFCCINAPFGKPSIRYWEPDFVIQELEKLSTQYGVVNLKIVDEMFVLHEDHFVKLCDRIIDRKLSFNIWAYARIDTIKPHFLKKLKDAGVNWLVLGIESGSKHVRSGVKKGRFTLDDIRQSVQMVKDHGIHVHGNYIFGLPDDTIESMQETLDLALELNTEFANFYSAMAYPGSQLYNMAIQENWKLPSSWENYSQHAFETLPLPTEFISAGKVLSFRDQAWQKYFTSPSYHKLLSDKFGSEASEHVRELTQIKLKRKFAEPI